MNRYPRNLAGVRFGRLVVSARSGVDCSGKNSLWECVCDCGNVCDVSRVHLVQRETGSCGCLRFNRTKGLDLRKAHPLYTIWCNMRTRCRSKSSSAFKRYGGRGVKVCDRWMDFEKFVEDMGDRPSMEHSIDRIDNNGDYEPGNCRWATSHAQTRNYSRNVVITIGGESRVMSDWAMLNGISISLASARIRKLGWSPVDAVTIPPFKRWVAGAVSGVTAALGIGSLPNG